MPRNPHHQRPARPTIPDARFNVIVQAVDTLLRANSNREEITDAEIIALAQEFHNVPGTLRRVKDALGVK